MIRTTEDIEEIRIRKPHFRFNAFSDDFSVQIRLEKSGKVFLSSGDKNTSTPNIAETTIEKLHFVISALIKSEKQPLDTSATNA
jgi:hypothetical protein